MGHSQGTTGVNWQVYPSGRAVKIFGITGEIEGNGNWVVAAFEVDPDNSAKPTLEKIIEFDRANGREHLIHEVRIGAVLAVNLFLSGHLTRDMLVASEESPETIVVQMELAGAVRRVVIQPQASLFEDVTTGTYDVNGELV